MSKERELLERALVLLEGSHYQDLVEEIRAYLAEPVVAESASTDLVDELVVALEYCIKKIPVFAYVPGISAALEKAKGDECV